MTEKTAVKKNNIQHFHFFILKKILLIIVTFIVFGLTILFVGFLLQELYVEIIGVIITLLGTYMIISYFLSSIFIDFKNLIDSALTLADINGSENILDVGCGTGRIGIIFAKRLTSGKVIGIDIWDANSWAVLSISSSNTFNPLKKIQLMKNSIDVAYRNAKAEGIEDKIEFRYGNILNIQFQDNSFDIITCNSTLNSLKTSKEKKIKALKEMKRVLKPNGKCILIEPLRGMLGIHLFSPFAYSYLNKKEELEEFAHEAGFSKIESYVKKGPCIFFLMK